MPKFACGAVEKIFNAYPQDIKDKLLFLRQLIFDTAVENNVGKLEETLKWGEPAYLTSESKSGSTIRIGWKKSKPNHYAIYFHCQTNLVDTFRTLFPTEFAYEGNRAIVFNIEDEIPAEALSFCISMALTYHRRKK